MNQIDLKIDGMSCQGCIKTITNTLANIPSVNIVSIDLSGATIAFDSTATNRATIVNVIEEAGFDVIN